MTKDELLAELNRIRKAYRHDPEVGHIKADEALLEYIGDSEVRLAFTQIRMWYS